MDIRFKPVDIKCIGDILYRLKLFSKKLLEFRNFIFIMLIIFMAIF